MYHVIIYSLNVICDLYGLNITSCFLCIAAVHSSKIMCVHVMGVFRENSIIEIYLLALHFR